MIRSLRILALVCGVSTISSLALAGGRHEGRRGEHHGKHDKKMEPAAFPKHVETRLSHARERISKMMDKHQVAEKVKTQVLVDFDAGAKKIKEAATKAAADGTLTKEERQEVRTASKNLKKELREKFLPKKA